jgi:ubiquinone/menaquinone biosynthesis C-methylase UbiE
MTWTSFFRHPEPPPWLYARMAQSGLLHRIYRRFSGDLAAALPAGARLLDVGTGPGHLPEHLAVRRPDLDLYGLDFSRSMIRQARGRQEVSPCRGLCRWLVGDAQQLPFPAHVFDQIVASFSLHIWPQPVQGLAEMLRVLKPGGRAWVYELKRQVPLPELRAFAREEGLPLPLVDLGFKIVSWHHALPRLDFERLLQQAAGEHWRLTTAHGIFWRAELERI